MPFRRLSYSHSGLPLLRLVLQLKSVFSIIQLFLVFARQSTIEKRCLWKSKGLVHCPGAFNIKIVYVTVLLLSLFITMSRMLSLVALLMTRNHRRIPVEWKIVPTYSNWINKNYVACFEDYRVTHHVVLLVLLTWKQKLHFSTTRTRTCIWYFCTKTQLLI